MIDKENVTRLDLRYNLVEMFRAPDKKYYFKNAPIGKVEIVIANIPTNIPFKLILDNL